MKIAGVVVVYYQNYQTLLSNLKSYASYLDKLYLFDNSYGQEREFEYDINKIKSDLDFDNIVYLSMGKNAGVCKALAVGLDTAHKEGYDYLLTMDQDSSFRNDEFAQFLMEFQGLEKEKLGIYTPLHGELDRKNYSLDEGKSITMTSGNIIDVRKCISLNAFKPDFFIDHIDHYLCLKVQEKNFTIEFSGIRLVHELGDKKKWLFQKYDSHSPLRFYYNVRNGLFTIREFPEFRKMFFKRAVKEFIKLTVFEIKIVSTIKYLLRARRDFRKQKFGNLVIS